MEALKCWDAWTIVIFVAAAFYIFDVRSPMLSRIKNPLSELRCVFLAYDNTMIQIRYCQVNLQLHFFIRFKSPDKINVDYILTVSPEEHALIKVFFKITKVFIGQVFFSKPVNHIYQFIFCIK